jgi:hypothetical protein
MPGRHKILVQSLAAKMKELKDNEETHIQGI